MQIAMRGVRERVVDNIREMENTQKNLPAVKSGAGLVDTSALHNKQKAFQKKLEEQQLPKETRKQLVAQTKESQGTPVRRSSLLKKKLKPRASPLQMRPEEKSDN